MGKPARPKNILPTQLQVGFPLWSAGRKGKMAVQKKNPYSPSILSNEYDYLVRSFI